VIETHEETATVRIDRSSACAHCKAGCMERGGFMIAEAENSTGANVGDTVRLEFNSRAALTAVLVVFGIPLLALLFGVVITAVVADQIGYQNHNQLLSIGIGAILFFLTSIPIRAYDRRVKKSGSRNVAVVEILRRETQDSRP
jgi:sigma-E factor negative regulatory protein RseC